MISLINYLGDSPKIKVMNLFLENQKEKYTKSAICRLTDVSRTSLQDICDDFIRLKLLKKTGYYYRLNRFDKVVKMFIKFIKDVKNVSCDN